MKEWGRLGFNYQNVIDDHVDALVAEDAAFVPDVDTYFAGNLVIAVEKLLLEGHYAKVLG